MTDNTEKRIIWHKTADYANRIFSFYFRQAWLGQWDSDNRAEIEAAVEDIINASAARLETRVKQLEDAIEKLKSTGVIDDDR